MTELSVSCEVTNAELEDGLQPDAIRARLDAQLEEELAEGLVLEGERTVEFTELLDGGRLTGWHYVMRCDVRPSDEVLQQILEDDTGTATRSGPFANAFGVDWAEQEARLSRLMRDHVVDRWESDLRTMVLEEGATFTPPATPEEASLRRRQLHPENVSRMRRWRDRREQRRLDSVARLSGHDVIMVGDVGSFDLAPAQSAGYMSANEMREVMGRVQNNVAADSLDYLREQLRSTLAAAQEEIARTRLHEAVSPEAEALMAQAGELRERVNAIESERRLTESVRVLGTTIPVSDEMMADSAYAERGRSLQQAAAYRFWMGAAGSVPAGEHIATVSHVEQGLHVSAQLADDLVTREQATEGRDTVVNAWQSMDPIRVIRHGCCPECGALEATLHAQNCRVLLVGRPRITAEQVADLYDVPAEMVAGRRTVAEYGRDRRAWALNYMVQGRFADRMMADLGRSSGGVLRGVTAK